MSLNKPNDSPSNSDEVENKAERLQARAENKELNEITKTDAEQHTAEQRRSRFLEQQSAKLEAVCRVVSNKNKAERL